ncbi:MAG: 4Fe-4S binding protein [Candidatus Cloacimonetes bacterium]|nr:4Fe-4S binding protein [Candidatus Cloacimonadota bacterium]
MPDLSVKLFGHTLSNPIMPAAGPNCRDAAMLKRAAAGGAGALVMKTVSVNPAQVPFPNIIAAGRHSLLNAELWSEIPVERYLEHEYAAAKETGLMLIASLGYTATELAALGPRIEATGCVDALECSVHYLGQNLAPVVEAMSALRAVVSLPIMVKVSPAIADIAALVEALDEHVDGYAAINSLGPCLDFDPVTVHPKLGSEHGYGWLSGDAVLPLALRVVHQLALHTRKPILGVGGVSAGVDAVKMLMAGATAVQVCSAAIREGQGVYGRIAGEMDTWLADNSYAAVRDIIGLYARGNQPLTRELRRPELDRKLCSRCGICVKACIHNAVETDADNWPVHTTRCLGCGYCVSVCPKGALRQERCP